MKFSYRQSSLTNSITLLYQEKSPRSKYEIELGRICLKRYLDKLLKSEIKEKHLQMLQYWYVKSKAFEVFMNIKYKIWRHEYLLKSLWNRIVKKYKCKNWFKKENFTNPDVSISPSNPKQYPRHKSYQQKESNSLWRIFWWSKKLSWGHRTFCHNNTPNMARSSLSNKELHQRLLKMSQHKIQFQFRYSLFECSILTTKKKVYKVRNVCHCGLI